MDVILTQDVPRLGQAGEKKNVKDGYARNFLLPRSLVVPASKSNLRRARVAQAAQLQRTQGLRQRAVELRERIQAISCTIPVVAGPEGKLHGTVTAADITQALQVQGIVLEKHQVELKKPVAQLGEYDISVKLTPEVTATFKLSIVQK